MLKIKSFAVAGDTTFIRAICAGDEKCKGHVFAKDAYGWHQQERDALLKKFHWEHVNPIMVPSLDQLLEKAEAKYLKEKP